MARRTGRTSSGGSLHFRLEANATRLEAIAISLEAIAIYFSFAGLVCRVSFGAGGNGAENPQEPSETPCGNGRRQPFEL